MHGSERFGSVDTVFDARNSTVLEGTHMEALTKASKHNKTGPLEQRQILGTRVQLKASRPLETAVHRNSASIIDPNAPAS